MKVFKSSILLFTILLFCTSSNAQKGHHLEFEIKNYASKEVIVFYYLGDKQYIKDTLVSTKPGYFLAKGKETLKPGMYGIFNTSTKIKFDFLVNQGEQHFKLTTDAKNIISSMQVVGSDENSRFYDYLNFISDQRIKFNNTTNLLEELQQNKEANRGKIEELERKTAVMLNDLKLGKSIFMGSLPDDTLSQKICLIVESHAEAETDLLGNVSFENYFSKYEIPKAIYYLQRFVYTPTGKINRSASMQLVNLLT